MKKIFINLLIFAFCFVFNNQYCLSKQVTNFSMLEKRDIQTCYLETNKMQDVQRAVISTLQDNGFIIQNVETDLGFIRAKKEVKLKRTLKGRVALYSCSILFNSTMLALSFGANPSAIYNMYVDSVRLHNELDPHTVIFDTNINMEVVGNRTKIRFIVIEKVLENADGYTTVKASPRKVVRHYEKDIYQEFFNQINKNLFLERSL